MKTTIQLSILLLLSQFSHAQLLIQEGDGNGPTGTNIAGSTIYITIDPSIYNTQGEFAVLHQTLYPKLYM